MIQCLFSGGFSLLQTKDIRTRKIWKKLTRIWVSTLIYLFSRMYMSSLVLFKAIIEMRLLYSPIIKIVVLQYKTKYSHWFHIASIIDVKSTNGLTWWTVELIGFSQFYFSYYWGFCSKTWGSTDLTRGFNA